MSVHQMVADLQKQVNSISKDIQQIRIDDFNQYGTRFYQLEQRLKTIEEADSVPLNVFEERLRHLEEFAESIENQMKAFAGALETVQEHIDRQRTATEALIPFFSKMAGAVGHVDKTVDVLSQLGELAEDFAPDAPKVVVEAIEEFFDDMDEEAHIEDVEIEQAEAEEAEESE